MYEYDINLFLDNELKRNEILRDLYPDEDEMIAKEEWLRRKGYDFIGYSTLIQEEDSFYEDYELFR